MSVVGDAPSESVCRNWFANTTVEALKKATKEELMLVKGIGQKTIEKIMAALSAEPSAPEVSDEAAPEAPAEDPQ